MPDTSSLPSLYNTAQRLKRFKQFPLLREPTHYTFREEYVQNVANFTRTALDTAHPDVSALKLVDEDTTRQGEDDLEFFRLYATVPATWDVPRSIRYDFPGYLGAWTTLGTEVSASVTMANSGTGGRLVVSKTAHGLAANSFVRIKYTINTTWIFYQYALVESVTTDTFTLAHRWVGTQTFASVSYAPIGGQPTRGIRTKTVAGFERHEYALPGVTSGVTTAADFLAFDEMRWISGGSGEGEPVTRLTGTTEPTNTQYAAAARAGSYFVKESNVDIYLGNILERVTLYVPYTL